MQCRQQLFLSEGSKVTSANLLFILSKNHWLCSPTGIYLTSLSLQHPLWEGKTTYRFLCQEHTADSPFDSPQMEILLYVKCHSAWQKLVTVQRAANFSWTYRRSDNDPESKVLQTSSWSITSFFHQKHQCPIHKNRPLIKLWQVKGKSTHKKPFPIRAHI